MRRLAILLVLAAVGVAISCGLTTGPSTEPGQVSIFRDEWGVPHIYAELEEDGYFGLGYAMAEDHLERFCRNVLMARGELATVLGSESLPEMQGVPAVELDAQMRMWRIMEASSEALDRLDPQLLENYESYTSHNPGHSDVEGSGHTDDQAEKLMSARRLKKVHFHWSELQEHIVSERVLMIPQDR